ncbi:ATP-binding protein [Escherichia coli]
MHELNGWVVLKWNIWATTLKACWSRQPEKELNYREFLCMALQQEWNGRHQRGVGVPAETGPLPVGQNLEQFDFGFQPGIDRKVVRELAGLAFVERSEKRDPAGSAWCG